MLTHHKLRLALLGSLLYGSPSWAIELADGKIQLHGFASQGMVSSSDNRFYGKSDEGVSLHFREIGINASYRPLANLQFSAQVISLDNGDVNENGLLLDYAFLDYTVASSDTTQLGVRLGRIKNPYGLYTTTRDVAFTRPSIVLPQSIYFDKARSIALSKDGLGLYATHENALGAFQLDMLFGEPNVDRGSEATFINADRPGKLASNSLSRLMRLMYVTPDDRLRFAYTAANIDLDYQARAYELDPQLTVHIDPKIISAQYSHAQWEFTAEYLQLKSSTPNLPPGITNVIEGYYLQGSYQMTPNFQAVLRYDVSYNNKDDHAGKKLSALSGLPPHLFYAKDWMLGLRYDVTPALMMRAEWHHIDGTGWLSNLDNPNPYALQRKWDMLMLLGSWRF